MKAVGFAVLLLACLVTGSGAFLASPSHGTSGGKGADICSTSSAALRRTTRTTMAAGPSSEHGPMERVLFVEVGFGADQHGQDVTKAAVRACRNAIEFNSIPCIREVVPGGYDGMKVRVQLAVPTDNEKELDLEAVRKVFPYGKLLPIEVQKGGMVADSGIAIPEMGDKNSNWLIAVAAVTVGY